MNKKAFIFTMDAVLALIPLFIILATVSQLSGGTSLFLQSQVLGYERIARDTLEVMSVNGDLESMNQNRLRESLNVLIPDYLNYSYEVEYNGSLLFSITNGSLASAPDIMVAKRLATVEVDKIMGDPVLTVGHAGSEATEEYCSCTGNQEVWEISFTAESGYDYWLVGVRNETSVGAFYKGPYTTRQYCTWFFNLCSGGTNFWTGTDLTQRHDITSGVTENTTNYVYIRAVADPSAYADYYVIRALPGTDPSGITPENAQLKDVVWVTLRVCVGT